MRVIDGEGKKRREMVEGNGGEGNERIGREGEGKEGKSEGN